MCLVCARKTLTLGLFSVLPTWRSRSAAPEGVLVCTVRICFREISRSSQLRQVLHGSRFQSHIVLAGEFSDFCFRDP